MHRNGATFAAADNPNRRSGQTLKSLKCALTSRLLCDNQRHRCQGRDAKENPLSTIAQYQVEARGPDQQDEHWLAKGPDQDVSQRPSLEPLKAIGAKPDQPLSSLRLI
jgi:hypothetical protein